MQNKLTNDVITTPQVLKDKHILILVFFRIIVGALQYFTFTLQTSPILQHLSNTIMLDLKVVKCISILKVHKIKDTSPTFHLAWMVLVMPIRLVWLPNTRQMHNKLLFLLWC